MDYVPTMVLKSAANIFGHLIANLANLSFAKGVFLSSFKVSQVVPLLQKPGASMKDMSNYRPITYLTTIGKILERLAMEQKSCQMENSPNHGPLQLAYRALHSTEMAITRVVNDLLSAAASKSPFILLSLDISAAFDTLDHYRLLERAKDLFGFDSTVLQWLGSNLVGREQILSVADATLGR